eukprot:6048061-Prymnesium_polylepis.1
MKAAGMLAITWQREYLEHIGIQQDFGCQALARIPKRFGSDRQVAEAFQEFQKACMYCVQKARVTKEVREAQQRAKEKAALAEAAERGLRIEGGVGTRASGWEAGGPGCDWDENSKRHGGSMPA